MSNRHRKTKKTKKIRPKKSRASSWSIPTLVGLLLTAIGLISLRPQIAVTPQQVLAKSEPFSAPFRVGNEGYLPFHVIQLVCYIHEVTYPNMRFANEKLVNEQPDDLTLDRQEGETIQCPYLSGQMPSPPTSADVVIVVDYKPPFIPWKFRRYFRFVGASGDSWQWLSEPSQAIQTQVDQVLDRNYNAPPYRMAR